MDRLARARNRQMLGVRSLCAAKGPDPLLPGAAHAKATAHRCARISATCRPARQQSSARVLCGWRPRRLPAPAVSSRRSAAVPGPRLCADGQSHPPAGDTRCVRRLVSDDAGGKPGLRAPGERSTGPHGNPVGRTFPFHAGGYGSLSAGLPALHRAQSGAGGEGGASRRLSLVQLSGQCARNVQRAAYTTPGVRFDGLRCGRAAKAVCGVRCAGHSCG